VEVLSLCRSIVERPNLPSLHARFNDVKIG
jgi:hypothetical protein